MSNDVLNNEVSASAELTATGLKAKLKSRAISAIDRLIGNYLDQKGVKIEAETAEERAISNAKIKIIDAYADTAASAIHSGKDPVLVRALLGNLDSLKRKQINKEAVVHAALEDLRSSPPSKELSEAGAETLDETFLNRFEKYSEEASTEYLRNKWAKILSAEIAHPGIATQKVMRIVDEVSQDVAEKFNTICHHKIGRGIVKCLCGTLSFNDTSDFSDAGLVIDPNMGGHNIKFMKKTDNHGQEYFTLNSQYGIISMPIEVTTSDTFVSIETPLMKSSDGNPGMPAYLLTEAGALISTAIHNKEEETFSEYAKILSIHIAPHRVMQYRLSDDGLFKHHKSYENGVCVEQILEANE